MLIFIGRLNCRKIRTTQTSIMLMSNSKTLDKPSDSPRTWSKFWRNWRGRSKRKLRLLEFRKATSTKEMTVCSFSSLWLPTWTTFIISRLTMESPCSWWARKPTSTSASSETTCLAKRTSSMSQNSSKSSRAHKTTEICWAKWRQMLKWSKPKQSAILRTYRCVQTRLRLNSTLKVLPKTSSQT